MLHQLLSTFLADISWPSINFRQLSVWPGYRPSTSVNPCGWEAFRHLLSTFHAPSRSLLNLCQISVRPENLPSTFFNLPCGQEIVCHLPSRFRAAGRLSVNFRQLSAWMGDLPTTMSTFCVTGRSSVNFLCAAFVNFRQHFMWSGDLL